ncbi:LPS export ABC transporter periplasmic protein LptC [Sphingobacterium phlebotomi]|uniref:LPS export ABC transporter periplasmic protein LptC n=1 Tax=Sphingobacterium phlebotomi TaxID=2605433 RepID=A0A5D4HCL1_9SPHI|nr:LPS export ABC transporter periplasmic protein LptC [Sphingobacterium phlebotomi]TYR38092.1 LPS export ABC transporter periplasmic protein LptC [Sphingobacterium phlebotomi]
MRFHIHHSYKKLSLPLYVLLGTILFMACENDLRDVEKIANIQQEENVNISKDVTVIYSDSAKVKAELTAPELREYPDSIAMYEFQKGVLIRFFDEESQESQRIRSEYAVQKIEEGLTEFRKNVVITMANGSIIKTEELFYDEKKQIYYNTVPITFDMKDGRGSFQATSFISDTDFKKIDGQNMTGFYIPSDTQQFPSFGN